MGRPEANIRVTFLAALWSPCPPDGGILPASAAQRGSDKSKGNQKWQNRSM